MAQTRISFSEKTVKKIMTNVLSGTVSKHWGKGRDLQYIGMVVATGATAPTLAELELNGFDLFPNGKDNFKFSTNEPVDIHVYCNKENSKNESGYLVTTTFLGNDLDFLFDPFTGSVVQIDNNHHEIHDGNHFFHNRFYSLADTATLNIVIETGAKYVHFVYSITSDTAGFTLSSYKTPAYNAGSGTSLAIFNNNQASSNLTTVVLRQNPTGLSTASATLIRTASVGTASNPANTRAGSLSRDDEVVFPPNTKWLLAITNKSSNANPINFNATWYEQ